MSKFELIKEYPGSPKLGNIHYYNSIDDRTEKWLGTQQYRAFPDYWKEIPNYIMTTTDDYDVIEGEEIYQVSAVTNFAITKTKARKEIAEVPSYFKYYKELGDAKFYSAMNGKHLTLLEILQVLNLGIFSFTGRRLMQAAKEKIDVK